MTTKKPTRRRRQHFSFFFFPNIDLVLHLYVLKETWQRNKCPIVYSWGLQREPSADFLEDPSLCHCVLLDTAAAESKRGKGKEVRVTKMVIKIERRSGISGVQEWPKYSCEQYSLCFHEVWACALATWKTNYEDQAWKSRFWYCTQMGIGMKFIGCISHHVQS